MSTRIAFLKGHGTENDFVIIPDPGNTIALPSAAVAALCDRRAGLGADGVLHVVRCAAHPEARHLASQAEWFMDYRNADGSTAEMCGNGLRVFARYLQRAGLVTDGDLAVATRGGVKAVHLAKRVERADRARQADRAEPASARESRDVTVGMGKAQLTEGDVAVRVGERSWSARRVSMGNPHAVAFVTDLADAGDLRTPPLYSPTSAYPQGVNVEFVVTVGDRHVAMRVHERGSGETRSCGTGACAVAVAAARRDGLDPAVTGAPATYTVDVPGGRLVVTERPDGEVELTGPAVIVAEGEIDTEWFVHGS